MQSTNLYTLSVTCSLLYLHQDVVKALFETTISSRESFTVNSREYRRKIINPMLIYS
jgi:hypothetical protein